jgi:hypothetical protein
MRVIGHQHPTSDLPERGLRPGFAQDGHRIRPRKDCLPTSGTDSKKNDNRMVATFVDRMVSRI